MKQEVFILKKKILTKKQCNFLINEYENKKQNSITESCYNVNTAKMTTSTFRKIDLTPETTSFDIVHKAIGKMIKLWINKIKKEKTAAWNILKNRTTFSHLYRLMCYEKGGWIHPHIDFEDFSYASCTINLNEKYKGGHFYFFNKRICDLTSYQIMLCSYGNGCKNILEHTDNFKKIVEKNDNKKIVEDGDNTTKMFM